jgi:hypothetical protein
MSIVLSKTHPTIRGRRNSYRERWALVEGRVYRVYADDLVGPWFVEDDTEAMSGREAYEYVESGRYWSGIAFTLAEARDMIARKAAERATPTPGA